MLVPDLQKRLQKVSIGNDIQMPALVSCGSGSIAEAYSFNRASTSEALEGSKKSYFIVMSPNRER